MCKSITQSIIFIFSLLIIHFHTYAADLTLSTSGRVSVEFVFSGAAFSNTLSINNPGVAISVSGCNIEPVTGLAGVIIGSEKISQRGCRVELDADNATAGIQGFNSGDVLQFSMCAQTMRIMPVNMSGPVMRRLIPIILIMSRPVSYLR